MYKQERSRGRVGFLILGASGALALATMLAAGGCKAPAAGPVGRLTVETKVIHLAYPECAALRMVWEPSAPLAGLRGNPRVFVHLVLPPRKLVRTFDHPLPAEWQPGKPMRDEFDLCQSVVAEPIAAGRYELSTGIYEDMSAKRWPLTAEGEQTGPHEYRVATVEVEEPATPPPSFDFSPGWQAAGEQGTGKQVLTRRWLFGAGWLRLTRLTAPGNVHLSLRVPQSATREVRVANTCGRSAEVLLHTGLTTFEIEVAAARPAGACEIHFAPVADPAATDPRSVGIESLAWKPAGS